MSEQRHASERQLASLLHADEDSDEFLTAAAHVESCDSCRDRLDLLAGHSQIDAEAVEMLREYPWEQLDMVRRHSFEAGAEHEQPERLDFLSPAVHPELLGRLGRYDIERIIGAGGMGIVLKGFDTELNRPVAIKVLARHLAHSGAARKRFARESRAAAAVVHEHVVAIHNVEVDSDVPFLVMEYVAGESLQARVDREGPLDTREILRIGIQAAAGLAAAHEQGVIHRDIKPANILLADGVERALLTDFGLARTVDDASLTHTGVVTGTPHYMSPEQANGGATDHRTDLFSLGAVMYFMATGHPPFRAERAMGVLNRVCHDRQKPLWQVAPEIPDELSVLVDRLLEKRQGSRIDSADEVKSRLTGLLAEVQQPRASPVRHLRRLVLRRRRHVFMSLGVMAACMIAVAWWALRPPLPASDEASADDPAGTSPQSSVTWSGPSMLDPEEFTRFESDVRELAARLEDLDTETAFERPVAASAEWNRHLQSLHERLDRVQNTSRFDSQFTRQGETR